MRLMVTLAATIWVLVQARGVVQPAVIAVVVWVLLRAVADFYGRLLPEAIPRPRPVAMTLSAASFVVAIVALQGLVTANILLLRQNLPTYEANLNHAIERLSARVGFEGAGDVGSLLANVDFQGAALQAVGTAANTVGVLVVIACYVVFIFLEAGNFERKLAVVAPDSGRRERVSAMLNRINRAVQKYLGVQFAVGVLQAVPTYVVLTVVGVDAPLFWAVLIFTLSFIPTIGTIIGIVFPSFMALVQFDTLGPFFTVLPILAVVQLFCSNWIGPRLMGTALNISPLAVLLAIFAGGAIWGIVGALVSAPILTVAVIAMAHVPEYRSWAVALSANGQLPDFEDRGDRGEGGEDAVS